MAILAPILSLLKFQLIENLYYVHKHVHEVAMLSHTATEARANFFQIIKRSLTFHEPQRISSPAGSVVVISEEDYDALQETLYLQSQQGWQEAFAQSKSEADQGKTQSFADVFGEEL